MREKMRQLLPLARKKLLWICSGILAIMLYLMFTMEPAGYPAQEATASGQAAAGKNTEKPGLQRIKGAEAAAESGVLHDPFSAAHEEKAESGQTKPRRENAARSKQETGRTVLSASSAAAESVPESAPAVLPEMPCLKGILCSNTQRLAVFSWKGQEFFLAEGEVRDGLELLEIRTEAVYIRDASGEHVIQVQK